MKVYKLLVEVYKTNEKESVAKFWILNDKPINFPKAYATYPGGEKVYWENDEYSHCVLLNSETIYRK